MVHRKGKLQQLSIEFADLPNDMKVKLAGILGELVMADGTAHPLEVADMKQIIAWLGVDLSQLQQETGSGRLATGDGREPEA